MSAKLVSYQDYVAGWLDSTLHDFLEFLPAGAASTRYALITCLDSNPNPASLRDRSPELRPIAKKMEVLGTGMLVPTRVLLEADAERQIFFGFDEVWFFPGKGVQPKPPSVSLVGPARLNQARLVRLGLWMSANACPLALGGGVGLNFVVRARGLVGTCSATPSHRLNSPALPSENGSGESQLQSKKRLTDTASCRKVRDRRF